MKNHIEINFDKILYAFEKSVTTPSFYWQSIAIIACFALTFASYHLVKKFLSPKVKDPNFIRDSKFRRNFAKYFTSLLLPALMMTFLAVGIAIFSQYSKDIALFSNTIQLIALFLFLRFLRIFLESTFIANLIGIFLAPSMILDIFGLLEPTIQYLDSYSVKVGSMKISIYTALKAFIILMIVFWLSGLISRKSKSYIVSNNTIKSSTKGIISKIIDIIIYFAVFIIILKVFGVDMTTLAVIGGAVGVGIGFGLQKIASNFISGIILLFEKSVEVGDMVELENNSITGTITHFGGRYTLVETFDGKEIMVPNEEFIINKVTNLTYNNNRGRIEIKLYLPFDSDVKKAQELMFQAAKEHPRCLRYPTVECYVSSFSENSVEFTMFFWVSNVIEGRMQPKSDVMIAIMQKFKEANINFYVQQREVIIKSPVSISPVPISPVSTMPQPAELAKTE
jgi:small-conductance mechanosensitive channel